MTPEPADTLTAEVSDIPAADRQQGPNRQVDLAVEGMTCGSCASRRTVSRVPGVTEAGANFATGRARVLNW